MGFVSIPSLNGFPVFPIERHLNNPGSPYLLGGLLFIRFAAILVFLPVNGVRV